MLTDDEVAELAALRARAYGAEADLSDDPAGLARLAALEDKARGVVDAGADAAAPSGSAPATDSPGEGGANPSNTDPVEVETSAAVPPAAPPKTWPRRMVLAFGIPVLVVAWAVAGVFGGLLRAPHDAGPSPKTTLSAEYEANLVIVRRERSWDAGSPRLLAIIGGTLVWGGTTARGTLTCISVQEPQQAGSACGATEELNSAGIGLSMSDPATGEMRTYGVWPNGAPIVTYTADAGGGHLFDCPECGALVPNPSVTISPEPTTGG